MRSAEQTNIYGKKQSKIKEVWKRLCKNKSAMFGLYILGILIFCSVFANFLVDPALVTEQNVAERLQGISSAHIFGTDHYGRDTFARVLYGSRISLSIGLLASLLCLFFGGLLGALAAFYGGIVDTIIMRCTDMLNAIPGTLLALAVVGALGLSTTNLVIAIIIANVPGFVYVVRSMVLTVVEAEYIEAARACGTSDIRIIYKHVIPNAIGTIIIQTTQSMSGIIMQIAGLSYIGMGVQPPTPEWGAMLSEAREYMTVNPSMLYAPGIFIMLSALSLNLVGDGLRDALDPKLKN